MNKRVFLFVCFKMTIQAITFIFKGRKEVKKKSKRICPFSKSDLIAFTYISIGQNLFTLTHLVARLSTKYKHLLGILLLLNKIQVF